MCAYVREAQLVSREERSLLQKAALTKWRIPDWVPAEGCLSAKVGDPNAPAEVSKMDVEIYMGVNNMPQDLSCTARHLIVICMRYADGLGEGTTRCQRTMHETHVHFMSC